MLSYLCHERVLLHACGRRGVASTLSTRKVTHFFADMQEKSHFCAILLEERAKGTTFSCLEEEFRVPIMTTE
jgi:hypothetical protein